MGETLKKQILKCMYTLCIIDQEISSNTSDSFNNFDQLKAEKLKFLALSYKFFLKI